MDVETFRSLVARGSARHPELRGKLEHAAFIALFRPTVPQLDGTWLIGSEHELERTYRVHLDAAADEAYCTCQDSTRHVGEECKHSLAALMVFRALADQLGMQRHLVFDEPPTPIAPALDYDRVFKRFEGA